VTLDRSLTYRRHLESLRKKLTSRVALLRRLAGYGWGAGATTLRIATLALDHSTTEYCTPVRCRNAQTRLIDPNHKRRHANCRHLTCWASSQWSHTLSITLRQWRLDICLTDHLSTEHRVGMHATASQIDTSNCTRRTTTPQFNWQQQKCGALGGSQMQGRNLDAARSKKLRPPCSNLSSFGSKYTVLNKVLVALLGLFYIPRSYSASP